MKTKIKDKTDWVVQDDLNVFGVLSDVDMNVLWPVQEVKQVSSPPKGRKRKNVHEVSYTSDGDSPYKKRPKSSQSPEEYDDPENKKKVAEFVKNLEKKNGNKKYTQTTIKLTSLSNANK